MVQVKVCGITSLGDARAALAAGAELLGFNFYERSPRYLRPEAAREIIESLPASIMCVGVFVNLGPPTEVARLARAAGVGGVQLHGEETPEDCRALRKGFYTIKALRVGPDFLPESALAYEVDGLLLDAHAGSLRGGTGRTFDWSLARRTRSLVNRLFLAGGLTPHNVAEAVGAVEPFAVDVCSGVETRPGVKDPERMKAFINAINGRPAFIP